MKELQNIDEAKQYFENLLQNNIGGKIQLAQIYHAAKEKFDLQQKEKPIREDISNYYSIIKIHIINDDYQIAEVENRKTKEKHFSIYYQFKSLHEFYPSFDSALIALLSQKYQNSTRPVEYICKMLQLNLS
jgi:hypothetical protein